MLERALDATGGIGDEGDRAHTLSGIAHALAQMDEAETTLQVAEGIEDEWERAHALSGVDDYGLGNLPVHLSEAGQEEALRELLLDYDWLRAKLEGTDVTTLIADYEPLSGDADAQRVGGALRLSSPVVSGDRAQLIVEPVVRPPDG